MLRPIPPREQPPICPLKVATRQRHGERLEGGVSHKLQMTMAETRPIHPRHLPTIAAQTFHQRWNSSWAEIRPYQSGEHRRMLDQEWTEAKSCPRHTAPSGATLALLWAPALGRGAQMGRWLLPAPASRARRVPCRSPSSSLLHVLPLALYQWIACGGKKLASGVLAGRDTRSDSIMSPTATKTQSSLVTAHGCRQLLLVKTCPCLHLVETAKAVAISLVA